MGSLDVLEYLGMHTSKHASNTDEDDFIFHEGNLEKYESSILSALELIQKNISENVNPLMPFTLKTRCIFIIKNTWPI